MASCTEKQKTPMHKQAIPASAWFDLPLLLKAFDELTERAEARAEQPRRQA
jgi:hypothetical protein